MTEKITTCQLYHYNEILVDKSVGNFCEFESTFHPDKLIKDDVYWLNFHSISDRKEIEELCNNLGVDKLTMDDIYKNVKRPKLEEYPTYMFFSIKSALSSQSSVYGLNKDNISFILGDNYLISFQEKSANHFPDVRDRIENKRGKIRVKGPDFLLFRMLESITDNYFEVLDDIILAIEHIEYALIHSPKSQVLKQIELQKRKLIDLRKIVFPLKDIASHLEKVECDLLANENHYYFSEIKDNCLTILEEIDGNKQILDGLSNLYFAVQGQRMNEIMKLLTIVSAIFIPLTFLVGVYGMNFENMPELRMKYGYFIAWGIMIVITSILLFVFYKRGWFTRINK